MGRQAFNGKEEKAFHEPGDWGATGKAASPAIVMGNNTKYSNICQGPRLFSSGGVKVIFQFGDHRVSFLSFYLGLK